MYRYLAIANYEDRFVIPTSIGKWRAMPSQNAMAAVLPLGRLPRLGQQIQPVQQ